MPSTATSILDGLSTSVAVKAPCRTVATANITLAGLQTVNGVAVVEDDRVLVKGQSTASQNGIYLASTGSWRRAPDFDGNRDVVRGTLVPIAGTGESVDLYEVTTANPITIDSTSIAFESRLGDNIRWDRTEGEIAASVVPANDSFPPGEVVRQATNTTPGTTDLATAFQAAIDSADAFYPEVFIREQMGISRPLLIRSTTQQSISIKGNGKAAAIIEPLAADIKVALQNVNCCIFNQNNNPHLVLENMEFFATAAYTGVAIYCKEGGGADGSGQALFSPQLRNLFVAFPSTNTGFLTGAMQNALVEACTFENCKGVFTLEGVGNGDCYYVNNSMYNSFDHFILQTADTNGSFTTTVDGLHVYTHNRGRVIDVQNWNGGHISNVVLEPASGNLGDVGLAVIKNSTNVVMNNLIAVARTGVPQANVGLEFEATVGATCSVKVSNSKIDAAVGLLFTGVGTFDIDLDNVDFTNSATACIQVNGNCSGVLRTRNCKFNNSQQRAILHSVANAMDWYSDNDEFLNAGLDGNAGRRNIDVATSGTVRLVSPTIGQNNGSAAAAFYIEAGGAGTVQVIHPRIVGTPPTGLKTGAQEVRFVYPSGYGGVLASIAALTLPTFGDVFTISGTTNITSIGAGNNAGRRITLVFQDILTLTDGSNLVLAGNYVTTANDAITLACDGTNWYDTGRGVN